MSSLSAVASVLMRGVRAVRDGLGRLLSAVVGDLQWRPPAWLQRIGRGLETAGAAVRAKPRASALIALAALAIVALGFSGWRWYQALPKPQLVQFTVEAPARTCIECDPPGNQVNPLIVRFAESVAPLEAVGKAIVAQAARVELNPAIAGDWTWVDDRTLQFRPEADWPVGQSYRAALAKQGLVAPQLKLAEYDFEFRAPAFAARVEASEFYQDPVRAADKKIVTTLRFSHAVDPAELERRLSLTLYEKVADGQEREVEPAPGFRVTYDKHRILAYVHSEALQVPAKEGRVVVKLRPGARAARGGNALDDELTAAVTVPGLYSLGTTGIEARIVRDAREEPSQALIVGTSHTVTEAEMTRAIEAWLLPVTHPEARLQAEWVRQHPGRPFHWSGPDLVSQPVLAAATRVELAYVPTEREHSDTHSFRLAAEPGRQLYVRVGKGLKSFGGYVMPAAADAVVEVPAYPRDLRVLHQGSLLALSGQRKVTVFARGILAYRITVGRLLPNQLQHLLTQSDDLEQPRFNNWGFDQNNITEKFTDIVRLPALQPGEPAYTAIDVGDYLARPGASRQGIFLLRLEAWDPERKEVVRPASYGCEYGNCPDEDRTADQRLLLLTDLGLLAKRAVDGSQDLFVQSIATGLPLAGVTVEVLGRNGEPVLQQTTDGEGHVRFPELRNLEAERQPVMYLARSGSDTSFLPLDWRGHRLDLSRFDVGGVSDPADRARLTAYLFSDRGIYRPGDEIRAAAIVRTQDWRPLPAGVPLRLEISDPRGIVVKRDTLQLTTGGFEEIRYRTRETAAAGTYTLQLFVVKERDRGELIGSIGVTVREFLPDRLRLRAAFTAEAPGGWVSPDRLGARVLLENLFGTPAAGRRVTATLRLQPAAPRFPQYEGFEFRDPQAAKEGFTESLPEQVTSATGAAAFDLNLQRFARATYRASLVIEGFEADGGRGVIAETTQLVSSLPFLVGWKADGDLAYVPRGTARQVDLIAIDAQAARVAASALKLRHIERRYLSMLLRQDNGTYRYESRLKEVQLAERPLDVAAAGSRVVLPTDAPGSYSELVVDADGQVLARIDYTVAGAANLTRSLEKNAELQVVLDKQDYAPGEEVELQVLAPYTGAGLITIERDRVYAWRWFRTSTTSSVQRIRLPGGLEGNAYVSVTFIRDPGSEEIHMAPLSYGVQPFSIATDARRTKVTLTAPTLVKPGGTVEVGYRSTAPGRIVVFAVDEGILQVARYRTPDPLGHFFAKRALRVDTQQILDRILPEFRNSMLSAPGGDEGGVIGARLNPFKRKTDAPVAWWSGIVEADSRERKLQVPVPENFNGTLRLMAVSVAEESIGTAEQKLLVRADLVLSPNAPLTVTPGDEFEVSVGVANNLAGSGPEAAVQVALAPSAGLEVLGASRATVKVGAMGEGATRFKVRAKDSPGPASLRFTATLRDAAAAATATLSLRPATPYMSSIVAGQFRGQAEVPVGRELYPLYRTLQAGVSPLPLGLAHGLVTYLDRYSYTCTEQVVSQSMPAIVLAARPEFGRIKGRDGATLASVIDELRARQDGEGAFRYWPGGVEVVDFVSVYAYHTLLEAAERGQAVPGDLLENGITYLRRVGARDADSLEDERTTAYAIYLLARQGVMVSNEASALQKRLEERHAKEWRGDIAAAWLAATFKLLRQDAQAVRTLDGVRFGREVAYDRWHDPMTSDAMLLYLIARHFPERLARLPDSVLTALVARLNGGGYHSLSAATTILALDAYAAAAGQRANATLAAVAVLRDKSLRPLALPAGLFPQAEFPADTRALRFTAGADLPGFYLVDQSGFDREPPTEALAQGLEVQRDYLDTDGRPLQQVKVGQEVVVRVRFRAIGRPAIDDAVFVDLLPGGFDLVVPPGPVEAQAYLSASTGEAGEGGDGEEQAEDCTCGFLIVRPQGFPDFADLREDRVVLYGRATDSLQEYRYRIKATNAGTFAVPPAYGESMYEPKVRARTVAARIVVTAP